MADTSAPGPGDEPDNVVRPITWQRPTADGALPPRLRDREPADPNDTRPHIPSADEVADLHPATDLFVAFLDVVSEYALGKPLRPRFKVSANGLLRGEVDLVKVELPAFSIAGLVLDRFIIRAERVRIVPGLPPKLVAEPVGLRAVVSQDNVDRWTKDLRLPVRLRLTEEGVVTTTGLGGFRFTEVVTMPDIAGGFLRLQPTRVSLLGLPTTMSRFFRGYLPLPPLPRNAVVEAVHPSDGELTVTFRIDRFEQALTPDVTRRLAQLVDLPIPLPRRG